MTVAERRLAGRSGRERDGQERHERQDRHPLSNTERSWTCLNSMGVALIQRVSIGIEKEPHRIQLDLNRPETYSI
eukprot:3035794-Pyramimonas_sp.AAC.1